MLVRASSPAMITVVRARGLGVSPASTAQHSPAYALPATSSQDTSASGMCPDGHARRSRRGYAARSATTPAHPGTRHWPPKTGGQLTPPGYAPASPKPGEWARTPARSGPARSGSASTTPAQARAWLWLGEQGKPPLTPNGVYQMIKRRARQAGLSGLYVLRFRHDFSHRFLLNSGEEGDLMAQNGWESPTMVHRYAKSAAQARSHANYDKTMGKGRSRRRSA